MIVRLNNIIKKLIKEILLICQKHELIAINKNIEDENQILKSEFTINIVLLILIK